MPDQPHTSRSRLTVAQSISPYEFEEMVKQARLVQGIQRIGSHGEYDGKLRDDDTLLFYADSAEQVGDMLRCALEVLSAR